MKLLIIEDDTTLSQTLAASLRYHDHEVRTAADGVTGLQAAADWTPDLIILDVMMPGMDGWEVCRRLRETWRTRR